MGLAVACEGLVRQHFRPWKIVPTSVMGIVTYARMLLLGGALTEWLVFYIIGLYCGER